MLGIASHQRLDESRLSYSGRSDDADDQGWSFFGETVDERHVEPLFFDIVTAGCLFLEAAGGVEGEGFGVGLGGIVLLFLRFRWTVGGVHLCGVGGGGGGD